VFWLNDTSDHAAALWRGSGKGRPFPASGFVAQGSGGRQLRAEMSNSETAPWKVPCEDCPLRRKVVFREFSLGFRVASGFVERLIYRELFPRGLTALDDPHEIMPSTKPDLSYLMARQEVESLLEALRLPINERGRRRAAARAQWFASRNAPLDTDDLLTPLDT
jgi:ATPase MipZ